MIVGAANDHGDAARRRRPRCIRMLGLQPGRAFDQVALDARIAAYEESLRERGYYQAPRARIARAGRRRPTSVNVTIAVEPGPARQPGVCRRSVARWQSRRRLCRSAPSVPSIRICSRMPASAIENALREQGYRRRARAVHARRKGRRAGPDVHHRARAAAPRLNRCETGGNADDRGRRSGAAAADQGRRAVCRGARRPHCRGDRRALSRARLCAGGGQARHPGVAGSAGRRRDAIGRWRFDSRSSKARKPSSAA